jgi:hypothetical protein
MRLRQASFAIGSVLFALVLLGLAGCSGKKFAVDEHAKVKKGMAEDKVMEMLGKPTDTAEGKGLKQAWWQSGDEYYTVVFKDGKVESAPPYAVGKQQYEREKEALKGSQ